MKKNIFDKEVLSIKGAMEKLSVSRGTIYNWIRAGKIKPIYIGEHSPRIPVDQLKNLIIDNPKEDKNNA